MNEPNQAGSVTTTIGEAERLRRWRLVLGSPADEVLRLAGSGAGAGGLAGEGGSVLDREGVAMDRVLEALYDSNRGAGLGSSSPNIARWLGDIRTYFPSSVVRVMQQDALHRLNLQQMLLEPELLASVDADVHLVANLMSLSKVMPERTRETARLVVRKVVDDLQRKLGGQLIQAVRGSLHHASRTHRPRQQEIDWDRTIRANLRHYQPGAATIIPEHLIGFGRKKTALRDIVLCVDQSGSMAASVVYSGIFGAVLASLRAVSTRMVVFDTAVVDLTEDLQDPVDLLFGVQLGGGTDINRALAYCERLVTRPTKTILVLITDLYEGGNAQEMLRRAASLSGSGVTLICLLALDDRGTPAYHQQHAAALAALGIPTFACTPDLFPDMMAAAIRRQDLGMWAARQEIIAVRGN